jgi:hypothetical protein
MRTKLSNSVFVANETGPSLTATAVARATSRRHSYRQATSAKISSVAFSLIMQIRGSDQARTNPPSRLDALGRRRLFTPAQRGTVLTPLGN